MKFLIRWLAEAAVILAPALCGCAACLKYLLH
jgi:hypothetical protein